MKPTLPILSLLLCATIGCTIEPARTPLPDASPPRAQKTASAHPETTFVLPNGSAIEMVWIPPGSFRIGSSREEIDWLNKQYFRWRLDFSHEGPQYEVTLTQGFWLGKYELTQEQWARVMGTRPWMMENYVIEDGDAPAVYISWDDVLTFIGELNEEERRSIYRLPTEAEWEYACRAGTTTRWSFGDRQYLARRYAWYRIGRQQDQREEYAHPVGTKLPNPWGLYDMHGNVAEWIMDRYDPHYYDTAPDEDPPGPIYGTDRVIRGGSFTSLPWSMRSAYRDSKPTEYSGAALGARIVREEW